MTSCSKVVYNVKLQGLCHNPYIMYNFLEKIRISGRRMNYEKNISAKEDPEKESSRIQKENGNFQRQKSTCEKNSKRQSKTQPLIKRRMTEYQSERISFADWYKVFIFI